MKRYSLEEIVEGDLCEPLLSAHVDEFYNNSLRQQVSGFFLAILLSSTRLWNMIPGTVNVYFNDTLYTHDRIIDWCGFRDDDLNSIIPLSELDITDCWKWIKKNTIIGLNKHSPVYFTALSYLFIRTDYEALLFAVLGLESLLVDPDKSESISYQFKKNLGAVFNTFDRALLKKLYKTRSEYVHGKREFSILDSYMRYNNGTLDDAIETLTLALVEMVRMLITNDATKFRFHENATYDFQA